jgi:hypothetical protein
MFRTKNNFPLEESFSALSFVAKTTRTRTHVLSSPKELKEI